MQLCAELGHYVHNREGSCANHCRAHYPNFSARFCSQISTKLKFLIPFAVNSRMHSYSIGCGRKFDCRKIGGKVNLCIFKFLYSPILPGLECKSQAWQKNPQRRKLGVLLWFFRFWFCSICFNCFVGLCTALHSSHCLAQTYCMKPH